MVLPIVAGIAGLALRAAPYAIRGARAVVNPTNLRNYFVGKPVFTAGKEGIKRATGIGGIGRRTLPGVFRPSFKNIAGQSAVLGGGKLAYDALTDSAEQSTEPPAGSGGPVEATPGGPAGMTIEEGEKAGIIKDQKEKATDTAADTTNKNIQGGDLDDFIKERIDLFEKYIGDDTRKKTKSAGYNAMIQFGLELATKRGNLVEAIAESAKEPLKEFAKLGNQLADRAAAIKKAGIESGVEAFESAEERKLEEKKIAGDIAEAQIRSQAQKLSPGEFITGQIQSIIADPNLVASITASNYDENNKKINPNISDESLIQAYAANQYEYYNAKEIPDTADGKELYESLPPGTMVYFKGQIFPKP